MGYAILFIMLMHSSGWALFPEPFKSLCTRLSSFVHTAGFLFLSGFGLYYSLSKKWALSEFYRRRIIRVLVPYMIISFPFYLFYFIVGENNWLEFIGNFTSVGWFFGGGGLWYISVCLLMYVMCPVFYHLVFRCGKRPFVHALFILLIMYALCFVNYKYEFYSYSEEHYVWTKTPLFVLGLYAGYLAKREYKLGALYFIVSMMIVLGFKHLKESDSYYINVYNDVIPFIGIPLVCCIIHLLSKYPITSYVNSIFKWLGIYSLELYILHMLIKYLLFFVCFDLFSLNQTHGACLILVVVTLLLSVCLCKPIHIGVNRIIS